MGEMRDMHTVQGLAAVERLLGTLDAHQPEPYRECASMQNPKFPATAEQHALQRQTTAECKNGDEESREP